MKNKNALARSVIIIILFTGGIVYFAKNSTNNLPVQEAETTNQSPIPEKEKTETVTEKNTNNLKVTRLFDSKVEILLPQEFTVMDKTMAEFKYPSNNRPEIIYTDTSGKINVALNRTVTDATEADLPQFSEQFEAFFKNAKDFQSNEITTQNGKKFIIIKMITGALDTDIFNLMAITVLDGKLFMVTFNCTVEEMSTWKPIGEEIIKSIKITSN